MSWIEVGISTDDNGAVIFDKIFSSTSDSAFRSGVKVLKGQMSNPSFVEKSTRAVGRAINYNAGQGDPLTEKVGTRENFGRVNKLGLEVMVTSLYKFICTGNLGHVRLFASEDIVMRALGPSEEVSARRPTILRYGNLQIVLTDRVEAINVYSMNGRHKDTVVFDDFNSKIKGNSNSIIESLNNRAIDYVVNIGLTFDEQFSIKTCK